ncbi:unnamed protein product [Microthlaspi erraticum]|uniref:Uncharacterized protein n=1 Tax=Microthlaspi erraticum TaxID=1685480 RepID=A0A6D2JD69_9BRAS|nr:unnamed protein product [Microthlaspi erraticum]
MVQPHHHPRRLSHRKITLTRYLQKISPTWPHVPKQAEFVREEKGGDLTDWVVFFIDLWCFVAVLPCFFSFPLFSIRFEEESVSGTSVGRHKWLVSTDTKRVRSTLTGSVRFN